MDNSTRQWIETLRHNRSFIPEVKAKLKTHSLNVNYFIDGNHLKLFLDAMIKASAKVHQRIFEDYGLGQCPQLPVNEFVYEDLIAQVQRNLQRSIFNKLADEFSKSHGINLLDDSELFMWSASSKKISSADEFFTSERAKKRGYADSPPELLDQAAFMNFFIGGEVDYPYLVNILRYKLKKERNDLIRNEIEELIKDINDRKRNIEPKTKELKRQQQFDIFKVALRGFERAGVISEVNQGEINLDLRPKEASLIEFKEKAVDTKLVMRCMDDLKTSKDNDVFVFVTNDTDFLPLFERVLESRQLIWLPGAEKKSKKLAEVAGDTRTFNLFDYFLGTSPELPRIATTGYWDTYILEPINSDFRQIREDYMEALGWEMYQKNCEKQFREEQKLQDDFDALRLKEGW